MEEEHQIASCAATITKEDSFNMTVGVLHRSVAKEQERQSVARWTIER